MKKRVTFILLIMLLLGVFTGCCLSHEWEEATCIAPKTCIKCEKTEGETLTHDWQEATCLSAKKCSVCNTEDGEPLPHTWSEATCTEGSQCDVCGISGSMPLGHIAGTKWEVVSNPTATAEGKEVLKCSRCDEVLETKAFRLSPEKITVLGTNGFTMSQLEYHQHLLRYLSLDYQIEDTGFGYELNENGYDDISIYWTEGEKGYQDRVTFSTLGSRCILTFAVGLENAYSS